MHNVTECQRRLIALGYDLGPDGADGKFGTKSLEAFNLYRVSQGRGLVTGTSLADLNALLFPEDITPTPQRKTIMGNLLGSVFSGLLGNVLNWQLIQGYVRSGLMAVSGSLVASGVITSDQQGIVVGAVLALVGVVWSAISNNTKKKAMDVVKAVDAAPGVTLTPASETASGKPKVTATP